MLIALYLWFTSIYGGAEPLADRIEDSVAPERREAALVVAAEIAALEESLAAATAATADALRSVHARHDASAQDYLEVLDPLEQERRSAFTDLLIERQALAELLVDEEWSALFADS